MTWRVLPRDPDQTWLRWVWLVYAVPFALSMFLRGLAVGPRIAIGVGTVLFLALYIIGHWLRDRRVLVVVAALAAMSVAYATTTPAAAVFFVYGAAFCGGNLRRREAILAIGAEIVVAAVAGVLLELDVVYYVQALGLTVLIGAITIHGRERAIANEELRLARDEVRRLAQLAERERIARDLHDLLGHSLSVIALKSELARKLAVIDPTGAAREIGEVESIAREGLAQVRSAITGYRSSGLAAEIETVRRALSAASIETEVDVQSVALGPEEETAIALALREATTNVIRHAAARQCRIRLYARDGSALLEIEDDGQGTDRPFGNGLLGMRERFVALGGALTREWVRPQAPRGTRLLIAVPLRSRA